MVSVSATNRSSASEGWLSLHAPPLFTLALLALAAGVIATWHGISYSHDGAYYLAFARAIQQEGLLRINLTSWANPSTSAFLSQWPPLYPMILSLGGLIGLDPIPWARMVSIAALVGSALLTYGIGWVLMRSRAAAWCAAVLFVAVPSTSNAVFALAHSEAVFTVMLLGMVWLLLGYRFHDSTETNRAALWAALIAGFMLLTRYIALGAVLGAGLYLVLWARTVRRPRRWWPVVFFGVALVPLLLWSAYLQATTGSWTGWQPSNDPLTFEHIPESLRQIAIEQLHGFAFPLRLIGIATNWAAFVLAGLFSLWIAASLWRRRSALHAAFDSRHALIVLVIVAYMAGFWALAARSETVIADWRHYVPVYPLLLILIVHLVRLARIPRWLTVVIMTVYLMSGAQAAIRTGDGVFWNQPSWRNSELLARLPELVRAENALLHSSEPPYLLLRLGLDSHVRMFGGDAGFREVTCADLTYPEEFTHAVFVVIDTPFLRNTPPGEVERFYREWVAPCGEVESVVNDSFVAVTTIRLNGR